MNPPSWAPHRLRAIAIAIAAMVLIPALVAQVRFRGGAPMLWPVPLFGLPTYLVVALFALPNRRSPLIGATVAVVLLAAVINVKFDLAKDAASDAQGAIAYMFILVLGLPAAAIGGLVTWLGAAVLNRRPEITT